MLKVCIDLNLQRIHVKVDGGFIELAIKAIGYLPFFLACIIFRLFALSLLLAYLTFWTLIPLAVVILINLAYEKKRLVSINLYLFKYLFDFMGLFELNKKKPLIFLSRHFHSTAWTSSFICPFLPAFFSSDALDDW